MSTPARHDPGLRRLHWLIAVLVAPAYLLIEQRGVFARGTTARAPMMQTHYGAGIGVLLFPIWRLAVRTGVAIPPITPSLSAWRTASARLLHLLLYAFIIVMPLLGLATAWTDGKTVLLPFTDVALPALLAPDEARAHQLEDLHGGIGEIFYWVIGAHVLAALYNHFIRRDGTLGRTL